MGVHDGHRARMRKRFRDFGLSAFEPVNALELLLFFSHCRADTNQLAHRLMERFGSFSGVLDAPYDLLLQVEGVGPSTATLLGLVRQAAGLYATDRASTGVVLDSTEAIGKFFLPRFVGCTNEQAYVALLDDKHKLLRCTKLSEGTANATALPIKKVVAEVVATNATGVILAHNHPYGVALPSPVDKRFTWQLAEALRLINVRLLDHIVVADDDFVSMAESGMLDFG